MTTHLVHNQQSADGDTIKLLVQLHDGLKVESVIMSYDTTSVSEGIGRDSEVQDGHGSGTLPSTTGGRRATVCVSSQVGCQMGCTFCATGTMGLVGDLTAGEIIEQLVHANTIMPIRNVVFMGMGEPLNNYAAVKTAVSVMTHSQLFALRRQAVTVSTVGVISRVRQLANDLPGISLALSLHAPTQELRARIVPSARAYPLDRLMTAIDEYQSSTAQRVFIEYVMLGPDVNCTEQHARELGALLLKGSKDGLGRDHLGKKYWVNLIPWNPIESPKISFAAPLPGSVEAFQRILREEYGVPSTIRQEKGSDVAAACGQLVITEGALNAGASEQEGSSVPDLEDLLVCQL